MRSTGGREFSDANDANVPVSIFLCRVDDRSDVWSLTASLYMPRRSHVVEHAFGVEGTRAELAQVVREHVRPLYAAALAQVDALINGQDEADVYYWEAP